MNQLISIAVAEKLSAIDTERYLADRAAKGSATKFRRVLAKVPAGRPEQGDNLATN